MSPDEPSTDGSYDVGVIDGLQMAARLCDETALTLDQAARESEAEGDQDVCALTGVGAAYIRHTAARIRAAVPFHLVDVSRAVDVLELHALRDVFDEPLDLAYVLAGWARLADRYHQQLAVHRTGNG